MISVTPSGQGCGATVTGVDLASDLDATTVKEIRNAWLTHHVLVFPDQELDDIALESFAETIGPIGADPFFGTIADDKRSAAVSRRADETGPVFAEVWHSDWSFLETPPAGTCLYGITIPPSGGDTLFLNEQRALEEMPEPLRAKLEAKTALHSARRAYAPDGKYAPDKYKGSMDIRPSEEALAVFSHPLIRKHPETGRPGLFAGSYVFAFEETSDDEAADILDELNAWMTQPAFQYRHKWQEGMLVLWDNRCVLHKATGGYEGYDRLLHRLTIADDPTYYLPSDGL